MIFISRNFSKVPMRKPGNLLSILLDNFQNEKKEGG
jgi:hypothetical protein